MKPLELYNTYLYICVCRIYICVIYTDINKYTMVIRIKIKIRDDHQKRDLKIGLLSINYDPFFWVWKLGMAAAILLYFSFSFSNKASSLLALKFSFLDRCPSEPHTFPQISYIFNGFRLVSTDLLSPAIC